MIAASVHFKFCGLYSAVNGYTGILEKLYDSVFYCEGRDIKFLWNVDDLHNYMLCYNPEDRNVNLQCCKNLKSFIEFVLFQASIGPLV